MILEPPELVQYHSDHDLLIRLDQKVDGMVEKIDTLTDDHETRIRALERQRWIIVGGATVLSTLVGYAAQFFHA
jgi:hypothetical protein